MPCTHYLQHACCVFYSGSITYLWDGTFNGKYQRMDSSNTRVISCVALLLLGRNTCAPPRVCAQCKCCEKGDWQVFSPSECTSDGELPGTWNPDDGSWVSEDGSWKGTIELPAPISNGSLKLRLANAWGNPIVWTPVVSRIAPKRPVLEVSSVRVATSLCLFRARSAVGHCMQRSCLM